MATPLSNYDIAEDSIEHEESPRPCATKASKIQAINPNVVHKICSGQVIITLSTAIKELVENSIDAGATNIDIRLKECGSKVIEVCDNGVGVEESNLEGLTLKHHTSKISNFEDLTSIGTFGFRGEALSSLCALAKLTVITKSANSSEGFAYKIEYDSRGKIIRKVKCAREKGTTVILENLFAPLPVRHREFTKNLKREFNKMVNVLYGYGVISCGIRINCLNQIGDKSSNILSIPALPTMKERIMTLFGSKQMPSLLEIRQCENVSLEILQEFGLSESSFCSTKYTLEGFISAPNKGRSSNDRQYFWINSRPCEPIKISRLINEVFHTFSRNQNPFVCLHIRTKQEEVDVNVTPDKRVIFLQNEKILCALLKATLLSLYSSASSNFDSVTQQMVALSGNLNGSQDETQTPFYKASKIWDTFSSQNNSTQKLLKNKDGNKITSVASPRSPAPSVLYSSRIKVSPNNANSSLRSRMLPTKRKAPKEEISTQEISMEEMLTAEMSTQEISMEEILTAQISTAKMSTAEMSTEEMSTAEMSTEEISTETQSFGCDVEDEGSERELPSECDDSPFFPGNCSNQNGSVSMWNDACDTEDYGMLHSGSTEEVVGSEEQATENETPPVIMFDDDFDDDFNPNQISVSLKVNWDKVNLATTNNSECGDEKVFCRKFRARIAPNENTSAEDELQKQITKNMFSEMKIIGQFNLGFIIVKSGPDMFIVDQHASDEKYNFETLEKTTVLVGQTLIKPMDLQLPAISENVIMDNLDIFQKNGFDFEINVEGNPSDRVKMTKIPFSKSVQFGKTDVEELIFMMEDCPEKSFCRPSKVREMFASRACRKSVMIGTAMNHQEMRSLINHMGLINQPWNCPHGRPTIRHLLNLNLLPDNDLNKFNH